MIFTSLPLLLEEFQTGNEMIWFMLVAFWRVNGEGSGLGGTRGIENYFYEMIIVGGVRAASPKRTLKVF